MPAFSIKEIFYACCPARFYPMLDRIETSDIGSRLVRGAFWSMLGAVISRGLMMVALILS
jgi:hypothetical protein